MTSQWQDLAAQKRSSEDRLIERYRAALFDHGSSASTADDARTITTPWGIGHRFHRGLYATEFSRRSAWPETQIVIDLVWQAYPERRFIVMRGIWPPERVHDPEPRYNDLFYINLWESIMTRASNWLAVQPGPVVYFIWSNRADLDDPPAAGDPPPELLSARAEVAAIKSRWLKAR
jgi:hypothetical protein